MQNYNQQITEIVNALTEAERKILSKTLEVESRYKWQTVHSSITETIEKEIVAVVEEQIK